jgi:hypothetical protein
MRWWNRLLGVTVDASPVRCELCCFWMRIPQTREQGYCRREQLWPAMRKSETCDHWSGRPLNTPPDVDRPLTQRELADALMGKAKRA